MSAHRPASVTDQMLHRARGEYLEMPGLRLTQRQAQRLWGLDEETCTGLLEFLVESKFLRRSGAGASGRLADGPEPAFQLHMVKANLQPKVGRLDLPPEDSRHPTRERPVLANQERVRRYRWRE